MLVVAIITHHVVKGSTISTDEHGAYGDLHLDLDRGLVKHSAKEWARGDHHVNSLESHWSLFKRAVKGTHVHISAKHAWKYVSEFSYRRNHPALALGDVQSSRAGFRTAARNRAVNRSR